MYGTGARVGGTVESKVRWGRLEKVANNHKQTTIGKIKREARRRERGEVWDGFVGV